MVDLLLKLIIGILFIGLTLLVYDGCVLEFTDRLPPDSHGKVEAMIIVVSMVLLLFAAGLKIFNAG